MTHPFHKGGDGKDDAKQQDGKQGGPAAGDYTPPADLPIPGETEPVPNRDQ